MQIGKLSQGILNMKIDTFDSRTTPSEGKIPGLAVDNPLGLGSGGKSKNSKKKVRTTDFLYFLHNSLNYFRISNIYEDHFQPISEQKQRC